MGKQAAWDEGILDIVTSVTHKFDYKNFEDAFKIMATKNCGKVILDWE